MKGTGYTDIDLAIYHPHTNQRAIVEVKGWHSEGLYPSALTSTQFHDNVFSFTYPRALQLAEEFFNSKILKKS